MTIFVEEKATIVPPPPPLNFVPYSFSFAVSEGGRGGSPWYLQGVRALRPCSSVGHKLTQH